MEQIKLDIVPAGISPVAHASQFDNGRQIRFNLFNQGSPYTLTGAETVTMVVNGEEENITNTSDNYVVWNVAEEDCEEVGVIGCEIRIVLGSMLIGSKNFFLEVEMDPYDGADIRTLTVGPADICTFETTLPEPYPSVTVNVVATGGNGTPDNPNPINGYSEVNIVNTQNESIVDLFSIDSDFRGTVAFNQLVGYFAGNVATISNVGTNEYKATSNALRSYFGFNLKQTNSVNISTVANNIYFVSLDITEVDVANITGIEISGGFYKGVGTTTGKRTYILKANITNTIYINATTSATSTTDDNFTVKNVMLIDLTQMFGSTIADYIYSLEQNNAGAGVEFFRSIYPDDYYAYDSGTTEIVGKETPEATIAFGQTVYGGVLDVTRGKLHVTWGGDVFDGSSDENWEMHGSGSAASFAMRSNITLNIDIDKIPKASYLNGISRNASWGSNDNWVSVTSGKQLVTGIQSITSVSDWVNYLALKPLTIIYELATPFDIDLTPEVISAIVGENNVFADCGQTTVKYLKEGV